MRFIHIRQWITLRYDERRARYVTHSRHYTRRAAEAVRMEWAVTAPADGGSPLLLGRR